MRKILIVLVSVAILATSQGAAFAGTGPKLALNPANHMNPGAIKGYNEAAGMIDIAKRAKIYSSQQGLSSDVFWNGFRTGGGVSSLKAEVTRANKYNPSSYIAMHSDGVPKSRGIMVLYSTPKAKNMGAIIGNHIAKKAGVKFEGVSFRPELLVLRNSKAPAILIEYLSHANLQDNRKLNDPNFRQKLAEATVEGYMKYWKLNIRTSRKPVQTAKPAAKPQAKPVAPNTVGKKSMSVMKINPVAPKVAPKLNKVTKPVIGTEKKTEENESNDDVKENSQELPNDNKRTESPIKSLVKLTVGYFKVTFGLGGLSE